ncbi:TlpA family protein disulfide reductase [Hydrotalea lipotrueae]|uniref:TlpA family protein disulfide reductase n=1 Tax=Hydrotalea lipotrueae TaxID=2803817 RepID=UPI001C465286|nr:TlpA disulfide reductase family protein [Hydrotalea lipotrueae]
MKLFYYVLLILINPTFLFAQVKFKIELEAPTFINDKLIISPQIVRKGYEDFYKYHLDTNQYITDFGKQFGFEQSAYQIIIQNKNLLEGEFQYPIPLSFQYFNTKTKQVYVTSTFFLDSGFHKIQLPDSFNAYEVNIHSSINDEYAHFKKLFSDLYVHINGNNLDSLTDLQKKEERIGNYIKYNNNSYVAFWEIVYDYTLYNFNHIYLDNLSLFSDNFKKTELFKEFEKKLRNEDSTLIGKKFPNINFDGKNILTKKYFNNYLLTFIDYWSTTCLPCIKAMPTIVAMYHQYKDKGIHFISVTDENKPERIKLAKSILIKNNARWPNYFDINKNFQNKVNATSYPLHLLVDRDGIILFKNSGNLEEVKKFINNYLK